MLWLKKGGCHIATLTTHTFLENTMSKAKANESSVLFTDKELYDLLMNDVNEALNFLTKNKDSLLIPSKQEYLYDEFINLVSKNFLDVPSSKTMFPKKTSYVQERVRSFIEHLRDMWRLTI